MKNNSPYSAAITGGGFLFEETKLLLPLLMADNAEELLKKEKIENNILMINSQQARSTMMLEVKRRYDAVPKSFWESFLQKSEQAQKLAVFYAILKTYKIVFDFHVNVTMKKWASISRKVEREDLLIELTEISANDEFVDSWSDSTKTKVATRYISILKQINMLDEENNIHPMEGDDDSFAEYLKLGEPWFLEFCLVPPYEVERIKSTLL